VDLLVAVKARPAVAFNVPFLDNERAVYAGLRDAGWGLPR
jgi:hypothetical protein